jgi:hypothetical protein
MVLNGEGVTDATAAYDSDFDEYTLNGEIMVQQHSFNDTAD